MAEKEKRTRRWDVTNKSRVGKGNNWSADSGKGPFSGYIDEAKDLLSKKSTWIDAAHQGVNYILESKALKGKVPRGLVTKGLGAPLELAKIAGKSAWILSSKERREENKKDFEKQSKTSVANRALSGYTNTAGNLVGMGQALYDVNNSLDDAALSELRGTPGYYSSRRDLDPLKDHTVNPWKSIEFVNRKATKQHQESEAYWKEKESEDAFGFSSDVFDDAAAKKAFGGDEKKRKEQLMQLGVRDESMDEWSPPTLDFSESSTAEDKGGYGKRPDGSDKGKGYLGELKLPNGGVATEFSTQSDAVKDANGERIDFPSIVPTLTAEETKLMTDEIIPNNKAIPEPIMQKAINHANMMLEKGEGVFSDSKTDNKENEDVALEMETKDIIKKVLSRSKEQP
tara:strand:+ start:136 stop:1329 length:1194 start_codon:yes stop_codon:yes gene_type:complete